jgi:hypothetical protein
MQAGKLSNKGSHKGIDPLREPDAVVCETARVS